MAGGPACRFPSMPGGGMPGNMPPGMAQMMQQMQGAGGAASGAPFDMSKIKEMLEDPSIKVGAVHGETHVRGAWFQ